MKSTHLLASILFASLVGCGAPETSGLRAGQITPGDDAATTPDTSAPDVATAPDAATTPDAMTAPDDVAAAPDAAPDVPPPTCVSGVHWTRGNRGSDFMNPGQACIACHVRDREAPTFSVAGTVFNDYHEEDNCNGFASGTAGTAYVEIIDATGRTWRLTANRVGNFFSENAIPGPFRRTRVYGPTGAYNEMSSAPASGDCNRCHTQAGTNYVDPMDPAPGRLTVPR
ncbi:MAG: hypothetical protein U0324_35390 [Polyangiales bacterium]